MKRTFNYTERRTLNGSDVSILLREEHGGWVFDANLERLSSYTFPHNAEIWVEAHRQNLWMQFFWGTIGQRQPPADRRLLEFDAPEGILFRVRVVLPRGPEHHKLVAEADGIRFIMAGDAEDFRRPLIVPVPDELDQLVWKLDFESDPPRLLVNKDAQPTWKELARSPYFVALVYPEVLRCILVKALIEEKYTDEDEDRGWRADWVVFARGLGGLGELPHPEDEEARKGWIDSAIVAFARRHRMRSIIDLALVGDAKS